MRIYRAQGGLALASAPQSNDRVPLYALNSSPGPGVPMMELPQIEAMKPMVGLAGGGTVSAIGSEVDPGFSAGNDGKDPRSRALDAMNRRLQQESSLSSANAGTMDILHRFAPLRRLTLPHLANPWASQYLARTPFDTAVGYGAYPTPEAMRLQRYGSNQFAEGGYAGGGEILRRLVNRGSRPFARALSKPVLGVEAVGKHPLSGSESDARFNLARDASMDELSSRPVHRLQGAWMGDHGMEYNPLYAQELPRTLGRVADDRASMRYAGQMGENLEQVATPVSRFVPHAWNTHEDANALQVSGIDNERLRALAELLGPDVVSAHRPGGKAMVFPLGDESIESLGRKASSLGRVRYGRSDPGLDRALLSREPLGYEDMTYASAGARPRTERYDAFEKSALRRPELWDDLKGAK